MNEKFQSFVEGVVFRLHVGVFDALGQDVLVKGARKVALQMLVIIDGFSDNAPDKFEVI